MKIRHEPHDKWPSEKPDQQSLDILFKYLLFNEQYI